MGRQITILNQLPAPCEGGCPNRQRCNDNRLACPAFSEYVSEAPWTDVSIEPTAAIYNRIYSGEENGA